MAPTYHHLSSYLLLIAAVASLISPALSLTCTSQTFSHINTNFTNCTDLPTLKASLHWTYNPTATPTPTLSIAFAAPPPSLEGWVAWALNPTGSGMIGAQSLIAYKDSTNGSIVVKMYNISSYSPIAESKIAYDVLNKSGEYSGGVMRIFATLALPAGDGELNQVWQVGSAVKGGVPAKHDFSPENLSSKTTFNLVSRAARGESPAGTASNGGGGPGRRQSGNSTSSGGNGVLGLYGVLVPLGVAIFGI
ncbi:hypothetical protein BUALT_Bualt02G0001300 [Buddleja alternifolia]|uniref:DOMON domain-containing protein n=1 Tax=Buddleja alternifolia TaxID=168488 RepID=A0AAV6Y3D3_9LAMI|nr:hypothetical protein BUALT_Bualt02G0001300 [Buddleja alternifolia]